jgi:hypothetical protein
MISIGHQHYLIEPPGIEGFVTRLKFRNEAQTEKLYLSSACGFLIIMKASRAQVPEFPSLDPDYLHDSTDRRPGRHMKAFEAHENKRMLHHLLRCRGAVRLRDILEVTVDDTCTHCRKHPTLKTSDAASKIAESMLGKAHDHAIVEIKMSDVRKVRFEVRSFFLRTATALKFHSIGRASRSCARMARATSGSGRVLDETREAGRERASFAR